MVKRWFSFIGKEIRGLHEAAYLLAAFALLSLVLALVRDRLLAFTFGAGHVLDVYYAAFRIPDLLFATLGSVVSASVLLPYFIDRFSKGADEGKRFSDGVFTVFFGAMTMAAAVLYAIAPWLVPLIIPGFAHDPALPALISSTRIMLLSPFLLGLSNLFSSLTQMNHRFLVYAASPVVYNAGIILGVVVGYPLFGVTGLAWGVALGALLHVGIQIPFMSFEGLMPRFTKKIDWAEIKKIALTSLPRTFTLSANELAEFFLVSAASFMAGGSISIFNFAFNLQSVPLSLIGASYSSAVFPTLSHLLYKKNIPEFMEKMIAAAQHIIFWSMPLTVLFVVLRAQIVRTILGAGKFDWADTRLTAATLAIFIISTIGQSLIVLFVRAFYAEGKTARPLLINAISAASIVGFSYALIFAFHGNAVFRYFIEGLFRVDGQSGTTVLMLALGYTMGVLLNTVLHWWTFSRAYKGFTKPVLSTLFHSFAASVIMGYATFLALRVFSFLPLNKAWGIFLQGFLSGLIGIVVLILVLVILDNKELKVVWKTLHKKFWSAKVPPAEVERTQ